jgi:hypothetical protein
MFLDIEKLKNCEFSEFKKGYKEQFAGSFLIEVIFTFWGDFSDLRTFFKLIIN